jgi:hypothetical protein
VGRSGEGAHVDTSARDDQVGIRESQVVRPEDDDLGCRAADPEP